MPNRFCDVCGTALEEGAVFCANCGKSFAAQQTPPQGQQYSPPPPPPPNYPPVSQPINPAPQQSYYQPMQDTSPLKVGQYMGMMLLSAIPIVGFILLLVWAFGSAVNVNKKNYARAVLIWMIIGIVFAIVINVVFAGIFASIINSSGAVYY